MSREFEFERQRLKLEQIRFCFCSLLLLLVEKSASFWNHMIGSNKSGINGYYRFFYLVMKKQRPNGAWTNASFQRIFSIDSVTKLYKNILFTSNRQLFVEQEVRCDWKLTDARHQFERLKYGINANTYQKSSFHRFLFTIKIMQFHALFHNL